MALTAYTTVYNHSPTTAEENAINAIWDKFQEQPVELAEHVTIKQHDNITTKLFGARQNDKPVWVVEKVCNNNYGVWVSDSKSNAVSDYIKCIEVDL